MAETTSSPRSRHPWTRVPRELGAVLRERVPRASERVVCAIRAEIPEYDRPPTGELGRVIRSRVERAIYRFVELIERRERDALGPSRSLYRDLGRGEFREGRSLDALLCAYRVGALVAWQETARACEAAGVEPSAIYQLAQAVLAYIHELSSVSAEGYSAERAAAAGTAQAARQELVELLTVRPAPDPRAVHAAADRAGWPLASRVAALASRADDPAELAAHVGPGAIGARIGGLACVLVPDPEGRDTSTLGETLRGTNAALGPTVSPDETACSWEWAHRALELIESRAIDQRGIVRAEAHLGTILLHRDETLARALATRWLAPLERLSDRSRRQLPETLLAWLSHQGDITHAAEDLYVHPQTVRYRLRKLRELYGRALDDPDARFELELALRAAGVRLRRSSAA